MQRREFLAALGAMAGGAALASCSGSDDGAASPKPTDGGPAARRAATSGSSPSGSTGTTTRTGVPASSTDPIRSPGRGPWVLVLGGGVGGMTAAHELAERGFAVTVLEKLSIPGGKARSIDVPGSAADPDRRPLPGEHGFRFFPGFYKHLPDTMKRIPFAGKADGVFGNLVAAGATTFARANGQADINLPLVKLPEDPEEITKVFQVLFSQVFGLPAGEVDMFMFKMAQFMSSCDARRLKEYESVDWWSFVNAAGASHEYQRLLAIGATRNFVASKAETASARTVALMVTQFLNQLITAGGDLDRVLDGPTNDAWINPWRDHLASMGVDYRTDVTVGSLDFARGRITGVTVLRNGSDTPERVEIGDADHVVCALPVEVATTKFSPELVAAAPSLARLGELKTEWMTGFQFFLTEPLPIVAGHVNFTDSPWALTSISQAQFWPTYDLKGRYGDGKVVDILSIDISDWDAAGVVHGKAARDCTLAEITDEVWAQVTAHLDDQTLDSRRASLVHSSFLDPAITFGATGRVSGNHEPLLVNTIGTWAARPKATTEIPNLHLASDYVQTTIDLATMEGANEAGRDVTNAILAATRSGERPCEKYPLEEPAFMRDLRKVDEERFANGLPGPLAG